MRKKTICARPHALYKTTERASLARLTVRDLHMHVHLHLYNVGVVREVDVVDVVVAELRLLAVFEAVVVAEARLLVDVVDVVVVVAELRLRLRFLVVVVVVVVAVVVVLLELVSERV